MSDKVITSAIHWKDYLDAANIEQDIENVCTNCKREQIRKNGKITITCSGMLSIDDVLSREEVAMLPLDEVEMLEKEVNRYKWAKETFVKDDGRALIGDRFYQEMMIRCLHGATNVEMSNGSYKEIKDIAVGDSIVSFREKNRSFPVKYKVLNKWNNGIKDTYKIKLKNGDSIIATSNHEFYAYHRNGKTNQLFNVPSLISGYTSIDKGLSVGDFLYVENKPKNFGNLNDSILAKILGYIVTDGYVRNDKTRRIVEFANTRREYVDELKSLILSKFGDIPTETFIPSHTGNDGSYRRDTWKVSYRKNSGILNFLESIGVTSKENREHGILEYAFNFTEESLKWFLNRLISGGGCVSNVYSKNLERYVSTISISSGSVSFLEKLRLLIKRAGVLNQKIYKQHNDSLSVGLHIRKVDDVIAFLRFTGEIFGKENQSILALETAIEVSSNRKSKGDRRKFSTVSRVLIESIEYYGKEEVYDIEVDTRHNFIANGIITHNCSAKRKVLRCGRRVGKAIDVETNIPTPSGFVKMRDITEGDFVFDERGKPTRVSWAGEILTNRSCYTVEFSDGSSVVADEEHTWTVETKEIRKNNARNRNKKLDMVNLTTKQLIDGGIKTGVKNESNYSIPVCKPVEYETRELPIDPYLFGYWLGDGHSHTSYITIGELDKDDFIKNVKSEVIKLKSQYLYSIPSMKAGLDYLGVINNKNIPDLYKFSSIEQRMELVKGLMDSDGFCGENGKIEFSNTNKRLSEDLKTVIESLGMVCHLSEGTATLYGKDCGPKYRLYINTDTILFKLKRKYERQSRTKRVGRESRRYITNITPAESIPVKCISVEAESSLYLFGENYNVTHNSFSMAVMITEAILRNEDYRVLVVTPFEVQAEEIFNLVKQLLNNVKGIGPSEIIERSVSSPTHFIKLRNGSRVRGFTTGSSGAGSVRGQGADEIFIDEIDYMTEKDFNSIMAILADAPDTRLTVASTPDGEKMLYKLSRTVTYKEFHFPTFVLPHYNDELDRDLRDTTDDIGYVQEFMAEFGSSRSSVFQKIFIKRALNLATNIYIEDVMEDRKRYALALGCDWNHENIGTKICISAMDKRTHLISPVVFESVSKEGWTQTAAMDKIIELNRLYVPEHIYVDEGFGYAQIEMLKKFAISKYGKTELSDPDLKLANIIGVNFSSSVKIRDPKTNEEKSRFIKQYMVENAVSFFEEGLVSLDLERDKTLEDELTGYIEKSRTPSGRIVYAASNPKIGDHNLDAFMLSLYALHMEYSDLFMDRGMPAVAVALSGPEKIEVQSRSSTLTGNKDLAYFSEPVKRLHYRTTSFEGETQRPYRGGRTKSLVSSRWTIS